MRIFNRRRREKRMEESVERLNSSLTDLMDRINSIEEELKRIDEKIKLLEEQNDNQTLINYGLMREIGMV